MVAVIMNWVVSLSSNIIRLLYNCLFSYLSFSVDCDQLKGIGPMSAHLCILSTHKENSQIKALIVKGMKK